MGSRGGQAPVPPFKYLFIDGACFTAIMQRFADRYLNGQPANISWDAVRSDHRRVFYYDAIPVQTAQQSADEYAAHIAPKKEELATIERAASFHVRTGDVRRRGRRGNEQKMVDVHLAVDAMLMASRGLFPSCSIVTGDLDFLPLVTALVEMGVDVDLLYPEGETNPELIAAADRASPVDVQRWGNWISREDHAYALPEATIVARDGAEGAGHTLISQGATAPSGGYGLYGVRGQHLTLVLTPAPGNLHMSARIVHSEEQRLWLYAEDAFGRRRVEPEGEHGNGTAMK